MGTSKIHEPAPDKAFGFVPAPSSFSFILKVEMGRNKDKVRWNRLFHGELCFKKKKKKDKHLDVNSDSLCGSRALLEAMTWLMQSVLLMEVNA